MKKVLIAVLLLVAAAATSFAQLNIGAGYLGELHTSKLTKNSDTEYGDMHGAYIGASYNICFKGDAGFGIAPGAYFKFLGDIHDDVFTHHTSVEVPVYLTYSLNVGSGLFFAYAGPAFNVGITYKDKWIGHDDSTVELYNYYDKDNGTISRFDLKVGVGLGYAISSFQFNIGWDFGCLNQYRKNFITTNAESAYRIHSWHLGVAYMF